MTADPKILRIALDRWDTAEARFKDAERGTDRWRKTGRQADAALDDLLVLARSVAPPDLVSRRMPLIEWLREELTEEQHHKGETTS